jgi:TonB-dependent receptor
MNIFRSVRLIFALVLTLPLGTAAQVTLRGTVTDSLTHETLVGANVYLPGTAFGGVTDREGKFTISRVPAGMHLVRASYIGFRSRELSTNITGPEFTLNFQLGADVVQGAEVVVTAQMRGQVAAVNQQITSNTIVNVISEEKIKELPDANAAEAIGRLPGVSIIRSGGEASKVILRGMSDAFSSFTIDGVRIPATDADSRGVDLSMFSQGTLAGVEVFKALTPDMDADAIAGSVNMVTRKAPSERTIRVDAKGAYNHLDNYYGQYDFNGKYGERFFNDVLGVQVTGNIERRDRSNEQFNLKFDDLATQLNGTGWNYRDFTLDYVNEIRKRGGASLLLDINTPDGGSIRVNNIFDRTDRSFIDYSRNYPVHDDVYYTARDRDQEINTFNSSLRGDNTLFDLNLTWGLSFAESKTDNPFNYTMYFREPSSQDSSNLSGMGRIPGSLYHGPPEAFIPYAYNNFAATSLDTAYFDTEKNYQKERTAYLNIAKRYALGDMLTGELKGGGKYMYRNRSKVSGEMMAPYYLNGYQDYVKNPDGTITKKNFAGTRFANLQTVGRLVLFTNFLDPTPATRNLYGKYSLNPLINRDALREWYDLNKNGVSISGTPEYYNNPEVAADYYDIVERVRAAYVMNTLNYGSNVTLVAGARVEAESNDYTAKYLNTPLGGFPVTGSVLDTTSHHTESIILPNAQLIVRPTDFMSVRLAAYRAIARPDFNARLDKLVARVTNPRDPLEIGNPRLKNAKAWNFELNTSLYGNYIGLFTVSAFYRRIDDMFHTVSGIPGVYQPGDPGSLLDTLGITWHPSIPAGTPITLTYSVNSGYPTKVWGFEFEHQADLRFLPGLLSNIVLSYNFSFVRSETFVLGYVTDTRYIIIPGFPPLPQYFTRLVETKQKLEGQPDFFGNAALGYDLGGFSGRVSVFFQGDYNRSYSAGRRSDPVVQKFSRWDLSLRQRLSDNFSVFLNLNNITSVAEEVYTVDRDPRNIWEALASSQQYGMSGDLGVRFEF